MTEFSLEQIAVVRSCYRAKFGIPRQPGLVQAARGRIDLLPPYNQPNTVRGLEEFSHIWVLFIFHQAIRESWKATVRPPRLGGDKRVGVFASRSPFRPSPVGLSVMKLDKVVCRNSKVFLEVSGLDLLDGTPVLDIKPYVPYADIVPEATGGFAPSAPESTLSVVFTAQAQKYCQAISQKEYPGFTELVSGVLAQNPRPAYQDIPGREYSVFLAGYEVFWKVDGSIVTVFDVRRASPSAYHAENGSR